MVDNSLDKILQGRLLRKTAKKMLKEEYKKIEEYLEEIDEIEEVKNKEKSTLMKILRDVSLFYLFGQSLVTSWWAGGYINSNLSAVLYSALMGFVIWIVKSNYPSVIKSTTESIYFRKLKYNIRTLLRKLNSNNREIKEGDIVPLSLTYSITRGIVYYPIYIDKKENIEKIILRSYIDVALAHEVTKIIIGEDSTKAYAPPYALQFLMYLGMNSFLDVNDPYKHKKVEEIIEENVNRCVEYVRNSKEINLHAMGECYMCIKLRENGFSIDINKEIEKLKYMNDRDIIEEVKKYAGVPYRTHFEYFLKHEYNMNLGEKLYKFFSFF